MDTAVDPTTAATRTPTGSNVAYGKHPLASRLYAVALLGAVIYAAVSFTTTYAFGRPPQPLGTGLRRLAIELSYQGMQIAYLLALWVRVQSAPVGSSGAGKLRGRPSTGLAIVGHDLLWLAPFFVIALVTPPLSTDPALYLKYGQMALGGSNPYLVFPGAVPDPVFADLIAWDQPSVYGPVALLFYLPPAALARAAGLAAGLYLLKFQLLLVHVGAAAVLRWAVPGRLLGGHGRRLAVLLYAANPLLLTYCVADGHIDGLLCLGVVLLWGLVARGLFAEAVMAAACTALVKALPLLWLPLLLGALVQRARELRARWLVPLALVGPLLLVALVTLAALPTAAAWRQLSNAAVTGSARSLYVLFEALTGAGGGAGVLSDTSLRLEQLVRVFIVVGIAVSAILRALGRLQIPLTAEAALWTLVLFAVGARWVVPWYAAVFVAFAPFLLDRPALLAPLSGYWLGCGFLVGSTGTSTGARVVVSLLTLAPVLLVPALLVPAALRFIARRQDLQAKTADPEPVVL